MTTALAPICAALDRLEAAQCEFLTAADDYVQRLQAEQGPPSWVTTDGHINLYAMGNACTCPPLPVDALGRLDNEHQPDCPISIAAEAHWAGRHPERCACQGEVAA